MDEIKNNSLPVFDELPPGWKVVYGANAVPNGYELISNGKSRFDGGYRSGLVKCALYPLKEAAVIPEIIPGDKISPPLPAKIEKQSGFRFSDEPGLPERLNRLAREEAKLRLLQDIARDITVCHLEGWDYKGYLCELREEIEQFT